MCRGRTDGLWRRSDTHFTPDRLAGLTLLALAFVPLREVWLSADALAQDALLLHALVVLALHSAFSLYKYYGETHIPLIQTWPDIVSELYAPSPKVRLIGVRKLSNLTASLGLGLVLWLAVWSAPLATVPATALAAIALGTLHFYTMEVDFRLVLGVRPFGFAPFYIAGAASLTLLVSVYLSLKP